MEGCCTQEIQDLLDLHIIERSSSLWSSPIVPVAKSGGQVRMCDDFHHLNPVIVRDQYHLPSVEEMLRRIGQACFLSIIDLSKGFFQVELVAHLHLLGFTVKPASANTFNIALICWIFSSQN